MVGRTKMSFHTRIILIVIGTAWLFVGAFITWQYIREKQFKTELLDTVLQMHNNRIFHDMQRGENIGSVVERISMPMPGTRVSLIDSAGTVTFDTNVVLHMGNHNDRPEVIQARKSGKGIVTSRKSSVKDGNYFYSATHGPNGLVVRSAVPYDYSLLDTIKADSTFLCIITLITVIIIIIGWSSTKNIRHSMWRLNRFAERAENGERIFNYASFPADELGSISAHIVQLYSRLQHVMTERDMQHAEAMKAEREKETVKKRLTIDINHELKTPVASIILSLETLRDFPDLPIAKRRILQERLLANALRLQNMLKDVSVITRMDEGLDMINMSPVPITDIVNEVMNDLEPAASRRNIELRRSLPPQSLMVNGNTALLESIFRNLVNNAILYSGGTFISVTCTDNTHWCVSDNGCGIPETHFSHIFDRFYRLEAGRSREAGGTGLGLAIVHNAIILHGGSITIKAANPGVAFHFTIPALK